VVLVTMCQSPFATRSLVVDETSLHCIVCYRDESAFALLLSTRAGGQVRAISSDLNEKGDALIGVFGATSCEHHVPPF
jgi:hypothetical protein